MTLKTLVTSLTAGAAAAVFVGAAAAGVTTIAVGSGIAAAQPAGVTAPLPAAPAPDLQGPLLSTLNALSAPGSFSNKAAFIEGGLLRRESIAADYAYSNAAAKGYFPLRFAINGVDQNGGIATANVTATAASGKVATQPMTFVAGPSPTGWRLSKQSALALVTSAG